METFTLVVWLAGTIPIGICSGIGAIGGHGRSTPTSGLNRCSAANGRSVPIPDSCTAAKSLSIAEVVGLVPVNEPGGCAPAPGKIRR